MYEEENNQTGLEKNGERSSYNEETGSELAQINANDASYDEPERDGKIDNTNRGLWMGFASLIVGIIALFTSPVLFGAIAIILGFIARKSESSKAGSWGIGLGILSVVLGLIVFPFF